MSAIYAKIAGKWKQAYPHVPGFNVASGGVVTYVNDGGTLYKVHKFTSTSQINVLVAERPFRLFCVGGGGGGGNNHGGGGGGGGAKELTTTLPLGLTTVTIGAGGAGGTATGNAGTDGGATSIGSRLSVLGGGGGGGRINTGSTNIGRSSGTGGGGAGTNPTTAGSGAAGQGYNGGAGTSDSTAGNGGGGGGAGAAGAAASGTGAGVGTSGAGGNGLTWLTGTYGGGGSGGRWGTGAVGAGGTGGGATGGAADSAVGGNGTDGLGGGGGGGGGANANGGRGGSGFAAIAYEVEEGVPVLSGAIGDAQAILTWEQAYHATLTVVSYEYAQDSGAAVDVGNVLTHTVTGLTNGQQYTFKVRAVYNDASVGSWSNVVAVTPQSFNEATGGTVTDVSNYNGTGETWRVHTFTGNGTFTVIRAAQSFHRLVVGGGSGGSSEFGGMTRGGDVVEYAAAALPVGDYAVTIGAGGGGCTRPGDWTTSCTGSPGGLSTFIGNGINDAANGGSTTNTASNVTSTISGVSYVYGSNNIAGVGTYGARGRGNNTGQGAESGGPGTSGVVIVAYRIG